MHLSDYQRDRIANALVNLFEKEGDSPDLAEQTVEFVFNQLEDTIDEAISAAEDDSYYAGRDDGYDSEAADDY